MKNINRIEKAYRSCCLKYPTLTGLNAQFLRVVKIEKRFGLALNHDALTAIRKAVIAGQGVKGYNLGFSPLG